MSSSLPAPPSFRKNGAGSNTTTTTSTDNTSGVMSAHISADMWAIDRSDIPQHRNLTPAQSASYHYYHHQFEGGEAAAADDSWGSSYRHPHYDSLGMDPIPMPPSPTDYPPPPPSNLVRPATSLLLSQRGGRKTGAAAVPQRRNSGSSATSKVPGGKRPDAPEADDYQELLISYKKYVDSKIVPRLTEALESLSVAESKIKTVSAELEDANADRITLRGSVQQLRSLLDQERVASATEHSETRSLLSRQMETEKSQLQAKLKDAERVAQQHSGSSRKLAELERTLELRDMEIRALKQQERNSRPKQEEDTIRGSCDDGLNTAESMGRFVAGMEVLVSEAVAFGRAFTESSANAGLSADYSPSVVWGAVREVLEGFESRGDEGVDVSLARQVEGCTLAIRKAIKTERACVSMSLGQLAASHAELLESIGNREHEMWRVKDMHQQRLEDLERDFNEQLQNLNAQLQYQAQYGSASSPRGGGAGMEHSPLGGNTYSTAAAFTDLSPLTAVGRRSSSSSPRYHPNINADEADSFPSRVNTHHKNNVVSTASQTNLELSLLFPPVGSASSLASSPASKGMPSIPNANSGGNLLMDRTIVVAADGGGGGGQTSSSPSSLNRVVSELKLLQDENIRLKEDVKRLLDERRKYLGFMRMGSEGVSSPFAGFTSTVSHPCMDVGSAMLQRSSLAGGSSTGLLLS